MRAVVVLALAAAGAVAQDDAQSLLRELSAPSAAVRDEAQARLVEMGPTALGAVRSKSFESGLELDVQVRLARIEQAIEWRRRWDAGGTEIAYWAVPGLTEDAVSAAGGEAWRRWCPERRVFRVEGGPPVSRPSVFPVDEGRYLLPYAHRLLYERILHIGRTVDDVSWGLPPLRLVNANDPEEASDAALALVSLMEGPRSLAKSSELLVSVVRDARCWEVSVERERARWIVVFGVGGELVSSRRARGG